MTTHLVEITSPPRALQLEKRGVWMAAGHPAGPPCPGFDRGPVPRRLSGHGPAWRGHELALTPGMYGLRFYTEALGNLSRPDRTDVGCRFRGTHGSLFDAALQGVNVCATASRVSRRRNDARAGRTARRARECTASGYVGRRLRHLPTANFVGTPPWRLSPVTRSLTCP